jgi:(E)-4-hydroxy-3-methylbut-2-enyl-diphosphate synthase
LVTLPVLNTGTPQPPPVEPPRRRHSRRIRVGSVEVGGGAPVSVQSMTTTPTHDVNATLQQIAALNAAGVDIVRVACPRQLVEVREDGRPELVCVRRDGFHGPTT